MDNKNVLDDIASKESWNYLRRRVVIWNDNIKLRYGQCREEAPDLWAHMEQYVSHASRLFKGIRLDNAHGTPLHVSTHMLDIARMENSNALIVAELFTGDAATDRKFVQ